ncbi:MAG TPA: DUF5818 domain-containing protein [Candidatus Acidoferrales bacterium]|nr:DUF5818 domain-containing protein [Candidatus Acidoferrales bacterium]
MKRLGIMFCGLLVAGSFALAAQQKTSAKEFYGKISDDMCGLKHTMGGSDKECTESCVKGGSKYVLADEKNQMVYQLSDQEKPKAFAGEEVKVTGTLKGDTITVTSIAAAEPGK